MNIKKTLRLAGEHHQAGRMPEAQALYMQILAEQPRHAEALHGLGLLAHQVDEHDAAVDLLWQAISVRPSDPNLHNDLGIVLAAQCRAEAAAAAYSRAIELKPDFSEAYSNLGIVLRVLGRFEEAIAAYREAIRCKPDSADAHYNLGNLLGDQDRADEAIPLFEETLRLQPGHVKAWHNLGLAYRGIRREDDAIAAYQHALELKPDAVETLLNLGNIQNDRGEVEKAFAAYRRAIEVAPDSAEAHYGLAVALRGFGRYEEADAEYATALRCQPKDPEARLNYSMLLLLRGEFKEGWPLYESRWEAKSMNFPRRNFAQPLWQGQPLRGERVLVYAEQGLGDSIQFVRYIPKIADLGGQVTLNCPREIAELLRPVRGVSELVVVGEKLPAFDHHVAMLSLPHAFGTTLETIPAEVPYLSVDPVRETAWRERIGPPGPRLKVGLVWSGNPKHRLDTRRSIPLAMLLPLFEVEGVDFYSLQKGRGAEEIPTAPPGIRLLNFTNELHSFADTAALLEQLDLVITVDTSVAHLAGALAIPVWTLIAFSPDWRWLLRRSDSPWYPTMRLFRQARFREWEPAIEEVREKLREEVSSKQ